MGDITVKFHNRIEILTGLIERGCSVQCVRSIPIYRGPILFSDVTIDMSKLSRILELVCLSLKESTTSQ